MKKTVLILLFICTLFSLSVLAQNQIKIYDKSNTEVTGSTLNVSSSDLNAVSLDIYLDVKNNTDLDMNLFVRRIINSEVDLSSNAFCFGVQCYTPTIDTSLYATIILPGATNTSFIGDYYPNQHTGTTSVTYEFFDNRIAGGPFAAQVTVNYTLSVVGLGNELKSYEISAAYPNPASASSAIEYNIPAGSNGKIILRNLLGTIVQEVSLDKQDGKAVINTNDLKDGLYFYSVILNNKVEVTRKLIVRH